MQLVIKSMMYKHLSQPVSRHDLYSRKPLMIWLIWIEAIQINIFLFKVSNNDSKMM